MGVVERVRVILSHTRYLLQDRFASLLDDIHRAQRRARMRGKRPLLIFFCIHTSVRGTHSSCLRILRSRGDYWVCTSIHTTSPSSLKQQPFPLLSQNPESAAYLVVVKSVLFMGAGI